MPSLTLSTGLRLLSEHIERAEYHPCGPLRRIAFFDGSNARHEQDFLYIRTVNGAEHVRGSGAAEDANTLEEAGVPVYRRPKS